MMSKSNDVDDWIARADNARRAFETFVIKTLREHESEFWIEDRNLLIAIILEAYDEHEHNELKRFRREYDAPYEVIEGPWRHLWKAP